MSRARIKQTQPSPKEVIGSLVQEEVTCVTPYPTSKMLKSTSDIILGEFHFHLILSALPRRILTALPSL